MAKIKQCEDIDAWQKARELSKAFYPVIDDDAFTRNFGLWGRKW
jgi:hypothetical protein